MNRRAWWATVYGVKKESDTTEHVGTHNDNLTCRIEIKWVNASKAFRTVLGIS